MVAEDDAPGEEEDGPVWAADDDVADEAGAVEAPAAELDCWPLDW